MPTKREELQWLESAYREFRTLVDGIDEASFEEKWLDGRWGVREIVAHIAGWLREMGAGLERLSRGERPAPEGVDWSDFQRWNDLFAQEAQGKSKTEVLRELDDEVARFTGYAAQLPEERFAPGKTANKIVQGAGTGHFHTHTAMIRGWLEHGR